MRERTNTSTRTTSQRTATMIAAWSDIVNLH